VPESNAFSLTVLQENQCFLGEKTLIRGIS
jgi:hypothetical protein